MLSFKQFFKQKNQGDNMPKKYLGCVVFDGDNTLWYNSHKYNEPALKCAEIICKEFKEESPYYLDILKRFDEIDQAGVKQFGFGKERFPSSWVQTYQEFCQKVGKIPLRRTEKLLYIEASKFWQPPFPMKKKARMVLRKLKALGFYLVLLTGGDPEVQQMKIQANDIKKYFNEIKIVGTDKTKELESLASQFGYNNVWMVGDSKKSDISKAIKAKVKAFYIPSVNWDYENWVCNDPETYCRFVIELKDIKEILAYF